MTKRIAIVPKGLRYQKVTQTRVSNGRWLPKYGGMASASREKAFRHVWSKRGDRRLGFFQFRITRDDGTIIDHTLLTFEGIWIRQDKPSGYRGIGGAHGYLPEDHPEDMPYWTKEGDIWHYYKETASLINEFSYNTVTQIWTVPFYVYKTIDVKPKVGKKFWVLFDSEDSVRCMYIKSSKDSPEYIYQTNDDFTTTDDYVMPDFYEVRVPYYKQISYISTRIPSPDFPDGGYGTPCGPPGTSVYGYCNAAKSQALKITVKSSIPYTIIYNTYGAPTAFYHGTYIYYDSSRTKAECIAAAYEHWYFRDWYGTGSQYTPGADYANPSVGTLDNVWIPAWVKVTTSKGDISNNIVTNPIDSEEIITPVPYTAETNIHRIDAFYVGDDPYNLPRVCSDGTVEFPLTFEIFRLLYSLSVSPNTT